VNSFEQYIPINGLARWQPL